MKKTLLFVFIAVHCSLFCETKQLDDEITSLEIRLDSLIQAEMKIRKIPSIALGIVNEDTIQLAKAYGFADTKKRIPATVKTIYQLGSVTKILTGNLLANLIANQKISLDDPLAKFFPSSVHFPDDPHGNRVTVKALATHSAGFPRYPDNLDRVDPAPILGYPLQKMYQAIEGIEIEARIGTVYNYSNFGYGVLGVTMENAMAKSLAELFSEYIFYPNQMNMTNISVNNADRTYLATPYLDVNPMEETVPWNMETLSAAGNVLSNIDDINKFMLLLLEKNKTNQIQQQSYLSINDTWSYGLGCFIISSQRWETNIVHHGGDVDGYASSLTLYPEYEFGFTILTNYGEGQVVGELFTKIGNIVTQTILTEKSSRKVNQ